MALGKPFSFLDDMFTPAELMPLRGELIDVVLGEDVLAKGVLDCKEIGVVGTTDKRLSDLSVSAGSDDPMIALSDSVLPETRNVLFEEINCKLNYII